jgi:hypothetical protein
MICYDISEVHYLKEKGNDDIGIFDITDSYGKKLRVGILPNSSIIKSKEKISLLFDSWLFLTCGRPISDRSKAEFIYSILFYFYEDNLAIPLIHSFEDVKSIIELYYLKNKKTASKNGTKNKNLIKYYEKMEKDLNLFKIAEDLYISNIMTHYITENGECKYTDRRKDITLQKNGDIHIIRKPMDVEIAKRQKYDNNLLLLFPEKIQQKKGKIVLISMTMSSLYIPNKVLNQKFGVSTNGEIMDINKKNYVYCFCISQDNVISNWTEENYQKESILLRKILERSELQDEVPDPSCKELITQFAFKEDHLNITFNMNELEKALDENDLKMVYVPTNTEYVVKNNNTPVIINNNIEENDIPAEEELED